MAHFEVYLSDGRVERYEIAKDTLRIGRSMQADIRIQETAVSRLHARLERMDSGRWVLVDLDSRNHVYFKNKPVKSHVLTHGDTVGFGSIKAVFHDLSGQSDQPADQTATLTSAKRKSQESVSGCPSCTVPLPQGAELCVNCGYNLKTGKRLQTIQDAVATTGARSTLFGSAVAPAISSTSPPAGTAQASGKPAVKIDSELIIHWALPIAFLVLFPIIGVIKDGIIIGGVVGIIGLIFRVVFMLIAMAIAAKIGDFGFGYFGQAILKIFGICAGLAILDMAITGVFFIFYLALYLGALAGLLYLFFDLDFFEMFLILIVMSLLNQLLFFILISAVASLFHAMPTAPAVPLHTP